MSRGANPGTYRPAEFYRRIEAQVLETPSLISPFKQLVSKGRELDIEFLEDLWPDYLRDAEAMEQIIAGVHAIDPTLTRTEIVSILMSISARME